MRRSNMFAAFCAALCLLAVLTPARAQSASSAAATAVHRCSVIAAQARPASGARLLSAVKRRKTRALCVAVHHAVSQVRFWLNPHRRWTLYLRQADKKCWQLRRSGPVKLCMKARSVVRIARVRLARASRRLEAYMPRPWLGDLALTARRRACIAIVETRGSAHPYTQQQLGGGNYWGKYQYDPGTWQTALEGAERFYHERISPAQRADQAPPWAQEVVTAYALAHTGSLGWNPWAECR